MYTTISGIYENGRVILQESAPTEKSMKVLVVFVEENTAVLPEQSGAQQSAKASGNHSFSECWQDEFKLADKTEGEKVLAILQQTGYLGSMPDEADLSENYKDYLDWGEKT